MIRLKESSQHNGMAEEYVLRFFSYLENHQIFEHSVKGFLNDYMKQQAPKKLPTSKLNLFKQTFSLLAAAYPNGITRGQSSTTPVNLYEALAVGTALALQQGKQIDPKKLGRLTQNAELKKITTGATNSRKMVLARINFVRDFL